MIFSKKIQGIDYGSGDTLDVGIGSLVYGNKKYLDLTALCIGGVTTDISDVVFLIESVEFPIGSIPPSKHNVVWESGETVAVIDIDATPSYNSLMMLHWGGPHVLNTQLSTIPEAYEMAIVNGIAGDVLFNLASSLQNNVNVGGVNAPSGMEIAASNFLNTFRGVLAKNKPIRSQKIYPR